MSLIITFMFEPAKLQMNWARASGRINLRAPPTAERSGGAATTAARLWFTRSPDRARASPSGPVGDLRPHPADSLGEQPSPGWSDGPDHPSFLTCAHPRGFWFRPRH